MIIMKNISARFFLILYWLSVGMSLTAQTISMENNIESKLKTFSVIGDSYSTFLGKTEPVDNAQYYPIEGLDVYEPAQTWWRLFQYTTGIKLEQNNSYSGGTICNTWWNGNDASGVSFVKRAQNLRGAGLIIVEGGTNDSNAGSPIGNYVYDNWTTEDLKSFRPATAWVLNYLKNKYPDAMIIFMLNDGLKEDINTSVAEICAYYDVPLYKLSVVSKAKGHPTYQGMQKICSQLTAFVNEKLGYKTINELVSNSFTTDVSDANLYVQLTFQAGEWTTVCLPFDVSASMAAQLFGEDATMAEFTGVDNKEMKFSTVEKLQASIPYLVKPTRSVKKAFTIEGIALPATTAQTITQGDYKFKGYYRITTINPTSTTIQSIFPDGSVGAVHEATKQKAFRANFSVPKNSTGLYLTVDGTPISATFPLTEE